MKILLILLLLSLELKSAEISPQFEVAGTGVAVVNGFHNSQDQVRPNIDLGNSSILFGATQALYNGSGVGSFIFGFEVAEEEEAVQSGVGEIASDNEIFIFPFQTLVNYQSKTFDIKLGRTDIPLTKIVALPILREEDLLTFQNPFSRGKITEESFYANLASFELNQDNIFSESIHFLHLLDSEIGDQNPWINALGLRFKYLVPPGRENLDWLMAAGLDYERIFLENGQNVLTGAIKFRLNDSITNRLDFRIIDVVSWGSDITEFESINDTFAANNNILALALNFSHDPFGLTGYQISLTGSWRPYLDIKNADVYQAFLTGAKRIGQGFDLVAQFSYLNRGPTLAAVYDGVTSEGKIELGLIFNFEVIFNQHLTPNRSILNYRHQYIPN